MANTLKVIGNCCLVFLAILGGCIALALGYYHFFVKEITIGVNYVDNQVGLDIEDIKNSNDLTEEEINELEDRYFLQVNYYSNDKQNGIMLQELQLNYFTDWNLLTTGYRSSGMQYIGDYQGLPLDTWDGNSKIGFVNLFGSNDRYYGTDDASVKIANDYVDKSFYYYDFTNGIHWDGVTNENGSIATELKRTTEFIVKIDDRAFALNLDKYFDKDVGDVRNIFGIGWKVGEKYNRYYYTFGSLFQSCMKAVRTNSAGYGDYYITVDLSSLFSIKEYDYETKKFKTDNVTDIIKNYAVLKFHYDENGARNNTQSMFGLIENSHKYDIVDDKVDTSYWQERMTYNLNEKAKFNGKDIFVYRYSEVYDGYFVSLNMDVKELFTKMPRAKVNLTFDLDSQYLKDKKINIIGLDYNAFEDFEIDTLTFKGTGQIHILDKALYNSNLQTLKYTSGLTFDIATDSINSEYKEVQLWNGIGI